MKRNPPGLIANKAISENEARSRGTSTPVWRLLALPRCISARQGRWSWEQLLPEEEKRHQFIQWRNQNASNGLCLPLVVVHSYWYLLALLLIISRFFFQNLVLGPQAWPVRINLSDSGSRSRRHSQCCRWRRPPGRWTLWSGRWAPYFSTGSSSALRCGSEDSERNRTDAQKGLNFSFRQKKDEKKIISTGECPRITLQPSPTPTAREFSQSCKCTTQLTCNKGMATFPRKSALRSLSSSNTVTSSTEWMSFTLLWVSVGRRGLVLDTRECWLCWI